MPLIELAIDFSSADSYLAFNATQALANDLAVEFHVLPYRVELSRIEQVKDHDSVAVRHQQVRIRYREMNAARYAAVQNLPPLRKDPYEDTTLALKGLVVANQAGFDIGIRFAEMIFRRYWHESLAIEERNQICSCLQDCGVDKADTRLTASNLQSVREELEEKGVMSVPMYVVKGELFQGRQHLPWIRELIAA